MSEQPPPDKPAVDKNAGTGDAPKLVFRPDEAKQARIRRSRSLVLWLILGGLAVVLVWLATYRPIFPRQTDDGELPAGVSAVPPVRTRESVEARPSLQPTGSRVPSRPPVPGVAEQSVLSPAEASNEIWRSARSAVGRWSLALDFTSAEEVSPQEARSMLDGIGALRIHLDSADTEVTLVADRTTDIGKASRAGTDNTYKLSVLYVAAGKVAESLREQAREVRGYLESTRSALRAAAAGEEDEYEVKMNVANGHRKRAEKRSRVIDRRLNNLTQAARETGG